MKEKLRLLVNDGYLARGRPREMFAELPFVEVVGATANGDSTLGEIESLAPDMNYARSADARQKLDLNDPVD